MANKFISEQLKDLDNPVLVNSGFSFRKRLRLIIINEDLSYSEKLVNYPRSYVFDVYKRSYLIVPKAIIKGKIPTLVYYYNNPYPIQFDFEYSKLTSLDLRTDKEKLQLSDHQKTLMANIPIDGEILHLGFNARVMRNLYAVGGVTGKQIIIILVAVSVIILVFLQVFGVVDVWGMITGANAK